jgi:hypothetical protein
MHTRFIATTTIVVAAIASCAAFSSPVQARGHQHRYQHHRHHHADHHQARHVRMAGHWRGHRHHSHGHRGPAGNSTDLASVSGTLAAKAREIVASCGSKVISSFRPGARIAGSGHASMHASGRAVDIRGNPSCVYGHLQGWRGGYSVDYASVQHVHISLGGHEDGLRFSHHSRHVRHGGHRYATGAERKKLSS